MNEKEELIAKLQEAIGFVPANTSYILHVLSRPDVIDATKHYIKAVDKASMCQKYPAPWNCAKEAEARYENIKYGWLGAPSESGLGFADWWCDACRKKVMED